MTNCVTYLNADLNLKFFGLLDLMADFFDQFLIDNMQCEGTFAIIYKTIAANYKMTKQINNGCTRIYDSLSTY